MVAGPHVAPCRPICRMFGLARLDWRVDGGYQIWREGSGYKCAGTSSTNLHLRELGATLLSVEESRVEYSSIDREYCRYIYIHTLLYALLPLPLLYSPPLPSPPTRGSSPTGNANTCPALPCPALPRSFLPSTNSQVGRQVCKEVPL